MVGLDLNDLDPEQLAWLEADLTEVNKNRTKTPWIMIMSHFPIFHSKIEENKGASAAAYVGDEKMGDYATDGEKMQFVPCPKSDPDCVTLKQHQLRLAEALQPIFKKYGVEVYNAGHVHSCVSFHAPHLIALAFHS